MNGDINLVCSINLGSSLLQEVAIKRMKSSKSKEFFAELKVLCKIHHINVVCYQFTHFFTIFLSIQM